MPIRLMVDSLMLKRIYNLGDETLCEAWIRDPYMHFFCGMAHFDHKFPCAPSDFVHFRKRIEKIFAYSVLLHGDADKEKVTIADTTITENNTTFPIDTKLEKKIIDKCNRIAIKEKISQRQTSTKVSKQYLRDTDNSSHPKRRKQAKKSGRKLKTIAGRLVRELERKLPAHLLAEYQQELDLFYRVLAQKRSRKNKISGLLPHNHKAQ